MLCPISALSSNLSRFLAPFGLSRGFPPLQSPIRHSTSSLLDFLVLSLRFNVQSVPSKPQRPSHKNTPGRLELFHRDSSNLPGAYTTSTLEQAYLVPIADINKSFISSLLKLSEELTHLLRLYI